MFRVPAVEGELPAPELGSHSMKLHVSQLANSSLNPAAKATGTEMTTHFKNDRKHAAENDNQSPRKRRRLRNARGLGSSDETSRQSSSLHRDSLNIRTTSQASISSQQYPGNSSSFNPSYVYANKPPSSSDLQSSIEDYDIPSKIYRNPYYSNEDDAPERPREYAGLVFHLKGGDGVASLEDWVNDFQGLFISDEKEIWPSDMAYDGMYGWEYASRPPTRKQTIRWLKLHTATQPAIRSKGKRPSQVRATVLFCRNPKL